MNPLSGVIQKIDARDESADFAVHDLKSHVPYLMH